MTVLSHTNEVLRGYLLYFFNLKKLLRIYLIQLLSVQRYLGESVTFCFSISMTAHLSEVQEFFLLFPWLLAQYILVNDLMACDFKYPYDVSGILWGTKTTRDRKAHHLCFLACISWVAIESVRLISVELSSQSVDSITPNSLLVCIWDVGQRDWKRQYRHMRKMVDWDTLKFSDNSFLLRLSKSFDWFLLGGGVSLFFPNKLFLLDIFLFSLKNRMLIFFT